MPRSEVDKIIQEYIKKLREAGFPISAVYLFRSYAKNMANKWSDIDIAIVSDKFKDGSENDENLLWLLRGKGSYAIEPYAFSVGDFENNADPMVYEIKQTGVRVG